MEQVESDTSSWTRLSLGTLIILAILFVGLIIYTLFTGFLWVVGVAMLYVVFIPIIFFIDIKTKRNAYIVFFAQFLVLLPVFFILLTLASQFLDPIPVLYNITFIVFALALFFASGIVYLILMKSVLSRSQLRETINTD